MKQSLPIKRIIAILSVALFYTFVLTMVGKCEVYYSGDLVVGADAEIAAVADASSGNIDKAETSDENSNTYIDSNSNSEYPTTNIITTTFPDEIGSYNQVSWWKAGLEEYNIIEDLKDEEAENTTIPEFTSAPIIINTTTINSAPSTTKATTAPNTTTEIKTTTTVPVTTTPKTTTTVVTTTPLQTETKAITTTPTPVINEIGTHDISNETLTVYDGYSGTKVTKSAFDIVCQMTYNEVGVTFNREAIKAQAVAAYTYVKYLQNRGLVADVLLKSNPPQKIIDCVNEVAGIAVYYNDKLIQATFSASTGGATASSKDVWGNSFPYLVSVACEYDYLDPHYGSTKSFSTADIKTLIESNTNITLSDNPENWFTLLGADQGGVLDGGYVGKMLIDGNSSYINSNGKNVVITGRIVRESIFAYKLKSAKFTVAYSNGTFTFTTYGNGHGVGLSQHGANLYAANGYTFDQILTHYYPGTTVK